MARVYSQHEQDQEYDGDMGFFSRAELGPYADRIFPLEAGEWVGPISINSNYFFFQCTGKSEEHAQTFDEARPQIEKTLKPFWKKKTEQKFLEKIRKDIRVVAYHERLTSIQLN